MYEANSSISNSAHSTSVADTCSHSASKQRQRGAPDKLPFTPEGRFYHRVPTPNICQSRGFPPRRTETPPPSYTG